MSEDPQQPSVPQRRELPNPLHHPWAGPISVPLYMALSVIGVLAIGVVQAVLLMFTLDLEEVAGLTPEELTPMLFTPGVMAIATILQGLIMVGFAAIVAKVIGRTQREAFAIRSASIAVFVFAVLGGLIVGHPMGYVAEWLLRVAPWLSLGTLEMLGDVMSTDALSGQLLIVLAVAVVAPISEELVFRGYIWSALEKVCPPWVTLLVTSILFACFHMDPIHIIGVFATGLFMGWIRLIGGSIWPCILMHATNNLMAVLATFALGGISDSFTPWWFALLATVLALMLVAGTAAWYRNQPTSTIAPQSA
jgi:membrane protease YdiL (CAAX protease family)